ncbi:hypothetical protein BH23ACT8_BH23ACT8_17860 [soil metagenome]
MASDFEQRLRAALRAQAGEVEPDPRTWRRVRDRIERPRVLGAVAVTGITAIVTALVVTLTGLPDLPRVRFDDRVAEQPSGAGSPSPAPPGPPGTDVAPTDELDPSGKEPGPAPEPTPADAVAVVVSDEGNLVGFTTSGARVVLTDTADTDTAPVFTPDGARLLFERRPLDGPSVIHELDVSGGGLVERAEGTSPAVSAAGDLGWIVDAPREAQPQIQLSSLASDDAGSTYGDWMFGVFDESAERVTAAQLSFDRAGERVFWDAGLDGRRLFTAELNDPQPRPLDPADRDDGARLAASAVGADGAVYALHGCCAVDDGDVPTRYKVKRVDPTAVREDQTVATTPLVDLPSEFRAPVEGVDLAMAHGLEPTAGGGWRAADGLGWLATDNTAVWWVPDGGEAVRLDLGVHQPEAVAVNPAAATPTVGAAPSPVPVRVFFATAAGEDCGGVEPVTRQSPTTGVLRFALEALLAGPTTEEREAGADSLFGDATLGAVRSVTIEDGTARIDLSAELRERLPDASTACASASVLAQLQATAEQFGAVDRSVFALDGSEQAFTDWLGGRAQD